MRKGLVYSETGVEERAYRHFRALPVVIKRAAADALYVYNRALSPAVGLPRAMTFYVTWRCNAKCEHCFTNSYLNKPTEELSLDEIERIFAQLPQKMTRIAYGGGEPFVRKDLVAMTRIIAASGKVGKFWSATNGLQPERTAEMMREICSTTNVPFVITASIQDLNERHDAIVRVPNAFTRIVKTVELLKEVARTYPHFSIRVLVSISNKNINNAEEILDFLQNKLQVATNFNILWGSFVSCFDMDDSVRSGWDPIPGLGTELPSVEAIEDLNRLLEEKLRVLPLEHRIENIRRRLILEILKQKRRLVPCVASMGENITLYPDGHVAYCELSKPFGNIRDFDLNVETLFASPAGEQRKAQLTRCACTLPYILTSSMVRDRQSLRDLLVS